MKKLGLISLLSVSLFSSSASAASLAYAADGKTIIGIKDVEVYSGVFYDAIFNNSPWTIKGYGETFAIDATIALTKLFTTGGDFDGEEIDITHDTDVVGFEEKPYSSANRNYFVTAYKMDHGIYYRGGTTLYSVIRKYAELVNSSTVSGRDGYQTHPGTNWWFTKEDDLFNYTFLDWGKIDSGIPSPVPVPASAFLFAPALLGFIGFRRKAKQA